MGGSNRWDRQPFVETKIMNTIPADLAGYQNIVTGIIQPGDVLVTNTMRLKMWAPASYFGLPVEHCDHDIYRKMECPRHEGQTNWEKQRAEKFDPADYLEKPDNKAKTDDSKKAPLAKLPWKALRAVSGVQQYGHGKYGDYYNYKKGMEVSRQISCAIRHLSEYMDGNDLDSESGHNHLAHAATRILFALENVIEGTTIDDRYKKQ